MVRRRGSRLAYAPACAEQSPRAVNDLLSALLLGIIEGLTEFLPISSTGHLLIAQHWLGARSDFFNIVIQAGAILATTLVFRRRIWELTTGCWRDAEARDYAMKLAAAFLVTALVGLPVRLAGWELPETVTPVAWALIIGGIWMLLVEAYTARLPDRDQVTWTVAIGVGLAQVLAGVFPGTSRSASAIFLAMLLGLSRRAAAAGRTVHDGHHAQQLIFVAHTSFGAVFLKFITEVVMVKW